LRTLARSAALVPVLLVLLQKAALAAEVIITPAASASPVKDFGGWTFKMALASMSLSALMILLLAAAYLRYAPRFYAGTEAAGGPPPVRPQARPGAAAAAVALDAPPLPRPAAPAPASAPATEAPSPEAPAAEAPPGTAPAAPAETPASESAPAPAAAPVRPAPAPRPEGPLEQDQETYDRVLAEEVAKGTDRRVAEGRAKSAAVRAARRKAAGG
jgi:hypothetical protein